MRVFLPLLAEEIFGRNTDRIKNFSISRRDFQTQKTDCKGRFP